MSNVVTHTKNRKKPNNSAMVIVGSLLTIVVVLFGLNYFLSKQNKKDTGLIEKVPGSGYTMGDENAKIKIIEYSDFQCPACKAFASVIPDVYKNINEKYGSSTMSLTYKHFPLTSIHQNALTSASAAEAARLQGKFWEMANLLFERQDLWEGALDAKNIIENYATELGLDMDKFRADRDSEETQSILQKALQEATRLSLNHTPTVFMNGIEMKDLSLSVEAIQKRIEDELAKLGVQPISQ